MALTVAQLTARLTADTSNFYKSMAIADASLFRTGSVAKRIGVGVGLAVAGMGIMALKTAGDFEQSMNTLGAVSGATTGELQKMQAQSIALGKDMKLPNVSAKDAAESMTELAKAGLSVKDIMGATRGVLQLGVAGNMAFAESATIVARALNAFKMKGSEATKVADLLTATSLKTTADINDMALGVQMASAQFKAAGFDIDDLTTSLGLMANAGIAGSDAGTSLKTMMNRLTAPTQTAKEKMKELGFSVYDASGEVKKMPTLIGDLQLALRGQSNEARNAALYTIFGSDAIRAARVHLAATTKGWQDLNAATTKGGEAQSYAEARTKGFNGAVQAFISQVETLAVEVGLKMLPAATSAARALGNFVGSLDANKITGFFGAIASVVGPIVRLIASSEAARFVIVALGAAFIGMKLVVNPLISLFQNLGTTINGLKVGFAFLAANPIVALAAGAVALTVGMNMLTNALRDTAITADMVAQSMQRAKDASLALENATQGVRGAELNLKAAKLEAKAASEGLKTVEADIAAKRLTGKAATDALSQAELRNERAKLGVQQASTALKGAISEEKKAVGEHTKAADENIKTARDQVTQMDRKRAYFGQGIVSEKDYSKAIQDRSAAEKTATAQGKMHEKQIEAVAAQGGPASKAMTDIGNSVKKWNFKRAVDGLNDVPPKVKGIGGAAKAAASAVGAGISAGIAAGITSAPAVTAAVRAVQEAVAAAKGAAEINSPSLLMSREVGAPLSEGMAHGVAAGSGQVSNETTKTVKKAVDSGKAEASKADRIGKGYTEAMLRGYAVGSFALPEKMNKSLKAAINKAKGIIKQAEPGFSKQFSRLSERAFAAFDAVTAQHKTATELVLDAETKARDAAKAEAERKKAQGTVDSYQGKVDAVNAMVAKEGETPEELQARKNEELVRLEEEKNAALQTLDDLAWQQRQTTLQETIAQEKLDYESQRENQRIALQDRLDALEKNLLQGKSVAGGINGAITKIFADYIPEYTSSGVKLGVGFASGLLAAKKGIVKNAKKIAKAVEDILKLNSPAKEGPMSNLNTWWDAFAPTLLKGFDEADIQKRLASAVNPEIYGPTLGGGIGITAPSSSTTINLSVTDQTLSGMSREQADRVARDIKAALDRQVNATF